MMLQVKGLKTNRLKICQTSVEPTYYHIDDIQDCNNLNIEKINITLEVSNVKVYRTETKTMKIEGYVCNTWVNFWNEKFQTFSKKSKELTEDMAKELIEKEVCITADGDIRKSNFNEGYKCNYSYMRSKSTETINCSFKRGMVQKMHFSNMTSTIVDTTSCSYSKGYCRIGNQHLLWDPIENEKFQYINPKNLTCSKINNHIICDEISKSLIQKKWSISIKQKHIEIKCGK